MEPDNTLMQDALAENEEEKIAPLTLAENVHAAVALKDQIEEHEAAVKAMKKDLDALLTREIPNGMNEVGTTTLSFELGNRLVNVGLEYKCRGTLNNAPDVEEAIAYLVDAGFEGALITKASIDFREGELDPDATARMTDLIAQEFDKDVHLDRKINPQTLMSFVRTKIAEDPSFDPAKVGATVMRQAKINIK